MDPTYVDIGGFWGNVWGKFKGAAKFIYKNPVTRAAGLAALNTVAPGSGIALGTAMTLVDGARAGNPQAKEQINRLVAHAAAGNPDAAKFVGALQVVNEAHKEAKPQIAPMATPALLPAAPVPAVAPLALAPAPASTSIVDW